MAEVNVEELRLPATVVARIVKDALPDGAIVSKEARTAIARAAAVFILNMTTYANDYAISRKRKTLTAEDVVHAVKVIECEQIEKPLNEALELWKTARAAKNEEARKRKADRKAAEDTTGEEAEGHEEMDDAEALAETQPPAAAPVKDIEDM